MKTKWKRKTGSSGGLRRLVGVAALALAAVGVAMVASCANPAGSGTTGYTASAALSAMDGKTDYWASNTFAAEEQDGATPTVAMTYVANAGDEGKNDGAVKLEYTDETGDTMNLQVFARITPQSLPTGTRTISVKVKPVGGCVKQAVAFVKEHSGSSTGKHQTSPAVSLAADTWTTVSVTVDSSDFTQGIYRIGMKFLGDNSDSSMQFSSSGTIYIDDFNALDYRTNDFSSESQLTSTCHLGSKDSTGFVQSWEASSSGDGYLVDSVTFPADTSSGWGAWMGCDLAPTLYSVYTPVDLSRSTLTFRIYIPQEIIDASSTYTWLSIYDDTQSTEIYYSSMTTLVGGWNTVSVNFADSRLTDSEYSSNTSYKYTSVTGLNIGVGTKNTALENGTYVFKLDYVDITPN